MVHVILLRWPYLACITTSDIGWMKFALKDLEIQVTSQIYQKVCVQLYNSNKCADLVPGTDTVLDHLYKFLSTDSVLSDSSIHRKMVPH